MYTPDLAPTTHFGVMPPFAIAAQPMSLRDIFDSRPIERYAAGEVVFWEGDPADDVFLVTEGCLRNYHILIDGRRAITGFAFSGDLLGQNTNVHYLYTAEAATAVELRRFPNNRFYAIVDSSAELRAQLFTQICEEAMAAQEQMILLGRKNAEERVVSFLLKLARRAAVGTKMPSEIELPVSRLDMADYLGLTIETVSRTISKLKRDGMIAITGQRTIALRRPSSLKEQAGDVAESEWIAGIPLLPDANSHRANRAS